PMHIEHDVVRRRQLVAVALGVERLAFARLGVGPLDVAELVVGMGALGPRGPRDVAAAAVVAEVEGAVWPDGQAVGPAAGGREQADLAIAGHTGAAVVADFRQHDRALRGGPT